MSTWQIIAAAIGLGIFALPLLPAAARFFFDWLEPPAPVPVDFAAPNYRDAIWNLAQVRFRLRVTDSLNDDQKKAIDVLTLALVDGSDE